MDDPQEDMYGRSVYGGGKSLCFPSCMQMQSPWKNAKMKMRVVIQALREWEEEDEREDVKKGIRVVVW